MNVLGYLPEEFYTFPEGTVETSVHRLGYLARQKDKWASMFFMRYLRRVLGQTFSEDKFFDYPVPPCRPGIVSVSVNFNGDVAYCHNTNEIVGHITDEFADLQKKHIEFGRQHLPAGCSRCEHLDICRGCCPVACHTGNKLAHCAFMKRLFAAIKQEATLLMTPLTESEIRYVDDRREAMRLLVRKHMEA